MMASGGRCGMEDIGGLYVGRGIVHGEDDMGILPLSGLQ